MYDNTYLKGFINLMFSKFITSTVKVFKQKFHILLNFSERQKEERNYYRKEEVEEIRHQEEVAGMLCKISFKSFKINQIY